MATTTVECPECQARLKVTDVAPGKRIRCPRCKTPFAVPAEEEEEVLPTARSLGSARPPAPPREDGEEAEIETRPARKEGKRTKDEEGAEDEEDRPARTREENEDDDRPKRKSGGKAAKIDQGREEEEGRPKRRKSKKGKKSQGSSVLMWSLVGGGAALLIGGGIVLIMMMKGGKTPDSKKDSAADGKKGLETNQLPVWAPDPQIVPQLADEVNVQGYRVRPPKGYQLKESPGPGGTKLLGWVSPNTVQLILTKKQPPAMMG
jgi:predicted Zn finger-like uncharacterized protein